MGGMAELFVATSPGEHGFAEAGRDQAAVAPPVRRRPTTRCSSTRPSSPRASSIRRSRRPSSSGKVDDSLLHRDGVRRRHRRARAAARVRAPPPARCRPQLAAWIAHEVLDALDYAHNLQRRHRPARSASSTATSRRRTCCSVVRGDVKLVDFGIARAIDPDRAHKSKTGTLKGKYGYMSPEQVIELPLDGRSDVFSVGIVLAELLIGRRLFAAAERARRPAHGARRQARAAREVRRRHRARRCGRSCAARSRSRVDERWPSAAAFRDALAEWLFEHRHRMTNKHVADVVGELREAVLERRQCARSSEGAPTAVLDELAACPDRGRRATPTPGACSIETRSSRSMPVISMSVRGREAAATLERRAVLGARRPRSGPAAKHAETARPKPAAVRSPPSGDPGTRRARLDAPGRSSRWPVHPERRRRRAMTTASIEIPIADTISAAVEAIVLPDARPIGTRTPGCARSTTHRGAGPAQLARHPAAHRRGARAQEAADAARARRHRRGARRRRRLRDSPRRCACCSG